MSSAGSALLISSSHELRNDNHFSHRSHLRHTLLSGIRHTLSDEISKVTGYPSSGDVRSSVPVVHEKNIAVTVFCQIHLKVNILAAGFLQTVFLCTILKCTFIQGI